MTKLFEKKAAAEKRTNRVPVLFTDDELAQVKAAAKVRNLDVSDFMRRAALGRRADVDYEAGIALALMECDRTIKALHAWCVANGKDPREDVLRPAVLELREAMKRISK